MKKLILIAAFFFVFTNGKSQTYTYQPFPDSLGIWSYACFDWMYQYSHTELRTYSLTNDTMTDGYNSYYETGKQIFLKSLLDSNFTLAYDFNLTVGDTFINPYFDLMNWGDSLIIVQSDDTTAFNSYWPNRRVLTFDNLAT